MSPASYRAAPPRVGATQSTAAPRAGGKSAPPSPTAHGRDRAGVGGDASTGSRWADALADGAASRAGRRAARRAAARSIGGLQVLLRLAVGREVAGLQGRLAVVEGVLGVGERRRSAGLSAVPPPCRRRRVPSRRRRCRLGARPARANTSSSASCERVLEADRCRRRTPAPCAAAGTTLAAVGLRRRPARRRAGRRRPAASAGCRSSTVGAAAAQQVELLGDVGSDSKLFCTCAGPGIVRVPRQLQHADRAVVRAPGRRSTAMKAARLSRSPVGTNVVVSENDGCVLAGHLHASGSTAAAALAAPSSGRVVRHPPEVLAAVERLRVVDVVAARAASRWTLNRSSG